MFINSFAKIKFCHILEEIVIITVIILICAMTKYRKYIKNF